MDTQSNRGVSPVIAVILMVAVTVILSAAVGAFVFNLGQGVDDQKQQSIGVTTGIDGTNISIQVVTGEADELRLLVDGQTVDSETDVHPGDSLTGRASNTSDVAVIAVQDGEKTIVSTENPFAGTNLPVITAPTDGLVSHWSFDDSTVSGSTVYDVHGSYDGSINGPTTGVTGISKEAFDYGDNSTGNYVRIANGSGNLPPELAVHDQNHTVVGWFKVRGPVGDSTTDRITGYIYGKDWRYGMWVDGNTIRIHQMDSNGGGYQDYSWTQDEKWHMIGQIYNHDTGNLKLILDGEIYDNPDTSNSLSRSESGLYLGTTSGGGNSNAWSGKIDEFRVYNQTLSQQEVSDLYNATK